MSDELWEDFQQFKVFNVPRIEGQLSIYGRFASAGGGTTAVLSGEIELDFSARITELKASAFSDTLRAGDVIGFTLETGEDGNAYVSFSEIHVDYPLSQVSEGLFQGSFTIPNGIREPKAVSIGNFTDAVGNVAQPDTADRTFYVTGPPLTPEIVGTLEIPGMLGFDVWHHSGYCFVSDTNVVQSINVTAPELPRLARKIETGDWNGKIYGDRNRLFVPNKTGMSILIIDPPQSAYKVGSLPITGRPRCVVIDDSYAYIGCLNNGLKIFDVGNHDNPEYFGGIRIEGYGERIIKNKDIVYLVGGRSGTILSVEDVDSPYTLSFFEYDGEAEEIAYFDGHLIIGTDWDGVWVFDVNDPENPVLVKHHENIVSVKSLQVVEPFLLVGGMNGNIRIVNVTDLEEMAEISRIEGVGEVTGMDYANGYLYAVERDVFHVITMFGE